MSENKQFEINVLVFVCIICFMFYNLFDFGYFLLNIKDYNISYYILNSKEYKNNLKLLENEVENFNELVENFVYEDKFTKSIVDLENLLDRANIYQREFKIKMSNDEVFDQNLQIYNLKINAQTAKSNILNFLRYIKSFDYNYILNDLAINKIDEKAYIIEINLKIYLLKHSI